MPQITKKQHYVPRLTLKRFGIDGQNERVRAFRIEGGKYIPAVSVQDAAQQNHFYGSQAVEKYLGKIEDRAAPILVDAIENNALPKLGTGGHKALIQFSFVQSTRAPQAIETTKEMVAHIEGLLGEPPPEDVNLAALGVAETQHILPMAEDLCMKLLCNQTDLPFVLGDSPAVKYNQFLESQNWKVQPRGIALRGFQLFLPISPKHTLVFFDKEVYKFGGKRTTSTRVDVESRKDVESLNLLQVIWASDWLYFNDGFSEMQAKALVEKAKKHRAGPETVLTKYDPANKLSGHQGVLVVVNSDAVGIRLRLQCASISPHASKYHSPEGQNVYRDPDLLKQIEESHYPMAQLPDFMPTLFVPQKEANG